MAIFLATDAEDSCKKAKKDKQTSRIDEKKRENLANEIFDYIHIAWYRRLFSLAWYDDMIYVEQKNGLTKPLPRLYYNNPNCLSPKPEFMQKKPFILSSSAKFSKINWEWIACQTLGFKKWCKETAIKIWHIKEMVEDILDNLIMHDDCLIALAKSEGFLDQDQLIDFSQTMVWYP